MFLVYEENYVPDCDVADEFALFKSEDAARENMEVRKQHYLEEDCFSVPGNLNEDADEICIKVTECDGTETGEIYIRLIKLDPQ